MAKLTGLFKRGSSYYLRVLLPASHPDAAKYRSGKVVVSLGPCSHRAAVMAGLQRRLDILRGAGIPVEAAHSPHSVPAPSAEGLSAAQTRPVQAGKRLREVFDRWCVSKPRSADSMAACERALKLFEHFCGDSPIAHLSREQGDGFRAWLQESARATTSKTARDRLTWIKSLLKYAQRDLGWIPASPWEGLDIEATTTHRRRPWSTDELQLLLEAPLHSAYDLPHDPKAGGAAAYWIPLLGMYTGARVGELAQLKVGDVQTIHDMPILSITDEGASQQVKTAASVRKIPVHRELVRLGFLAYVASLRKAGTAQRLWPDLPMREGKPGGYFSDWFARYRRTLGLGPYPDFHCFRHTVRSLLADKEVAEPMIDTLIGHEVKGSTGTRVYTHRSLAALASALEQLDLGIHPQRCYPRLQAP